LKAEHMAAPTNAAYVKKALANSEPSTHGNIRAGTLRALGVTTNARSLLLPDIPTVGEFVAGYEASAWNGIGAPKNTPADVIEKLNREITAGVSEPKIKARLAELGSVSMPIRFPNLANLSPM